MKKIALFVTALAVSLSLGGKALADTNTATLADKAGITPDNVLLYPIDKAIDNIRINLTFGKDKKAQVLIDVAEERLGESEVMADKGKTDLSTQAINDYNDKMTEAQDDIENIVDNTANNTATTTSANTTENNTASSTTDSAVKLDNPNTAEAALENHITISIDVLKNIENKVSGNAKETIAQVIEMQTRKKEAIAAVIQERQTLIQDKNAVKQAEKALEQAKKSNDAQAITTAQNALTQAQQALTTENTKFAQVLSAKKEAMKGGVGQLKKLAKQAENNQTGNTANSSSTTTQADNSTTPATTAPATNATTSTPASTSTVTDNTSITNNTNSDTTTYKNKGQEMKAQNAKGKKGQEMKAKNANSSSHENDSED